MSGFALGTRFRVRGGRCRATLLVQGSGIEIEIGIGLEDVGLRPRYGCQGGISRRQGYGLTSWRARVNSGELRINPNGFYYLSVNREP